MCVSNQTVSVVLDLKAKNMLGKVENLIMFDHPKDSQISLATMSGLNMYNYHDLVAEGKRLTSSDTPRRVEPLYDSIYMLGITSGTTGEPKVAMLTHRNFISGQVCGDWLGFDFTPDDVYLSYAPLTHVAE